MEKKFDVIGVENLIMDFPVQINRLPKTDGFALMKDFCWQSGGNASSAIVAVSRLGGKCAMIGTVGNDPFGDFCRRDMERHNVDISHVKILDGETSFCMCLAEEETQGRSFIAKPGVRGELTPEEVDESFVSSARAVHMNLSPMPMMKYAAEFAKKNGVLVSVDAAGPFPGSTEAAKEVDLLVMSEMFYKGTFGAEDTNYEANCKDFLKYGPKAVVVTLGSKGCAGADQDGTFFLPAWNEGYDIIDTTGAGDVFHGGFVYAWLNRYKQAPWNYTVEDCARFASVVSYINCNTLGGRTGIPTLEMVDSFLKDRKILPGDIAERKAYYHTAMFTK